MLLIGGMIWGVSSSVHEAAHVDPRYGHVVNADLAEYVVPVHADIPVIEAIFLDDVDDRANPPGIKASANSGFAAPALLSLTRSSTRRASACWTSRSQTRSSCRGCPTPP